MKVSVCIATYNGEPYIRQQLESILNQTRKPDEIIICDDGSSDKTISIINDVYQKTSVEIRLYENEKRLGYSKNFEKSLGLSEGDIIFMSDQDDFWLESKISKIVNKIDCKDESVVINDCYFADENLNIDGETKLDRIRRNGLDDTSFVSGCCTAISGKIKSLILPIPTEHFTYDDWIHKVSYKIKKRYIIEEPLQVYRIHGKNTSESHINQKNKLSFLAKANKRFNNNLTKSLDERINGLKVLYIRLKERYKLDISYNEKSLRGITQEIELLQTRSCCRRQNIARRVVLSVKMFYEGKYSHFNGWKSMLRDVAGL